MPDYRQLGAASRGGEAVPTERRSRRFGSEAGPRDLRPRRFNHGPRQRQ